MSISTSAFLANDCVMQIGSIRVFCSRV